MSFLDVNGGGTVYMAVPSVFKDALACSFRYAGHEKLMVKAGEFQALKVEFIVTDPFLSKILEPMMKGSEVLIDAQTRIMLVGKGAGSESELVEIGSRK